ncbi:MULTISPECIES: YhbP family protein [Tenebrionibacter/Tenebrionicola group]|jgi:uncharacterized protein YhbP (UPF0306 family)|uniref:UPF0306 protein JJB97_07405 n=2 Tax=Tenebrionibacter/Tenebrionicola group TaxID=2969848 RepID=A0A8K0XX16_9ENTR|nr:MULTISPECIES: YhbP family protein [Tenebrionibacter/Tenebrionicola group]MBK4715158.1 YhbP family protein [Tenebrionibacter intestinalis]MBV5095877.1 YhbP family protein [Tenebrionicola larvae]
MDALSTISRWLNRQHVITYCVSNGDDFWCANAFYIWDAGRAAFYLLSDTSTRHAQIAGERACVAGTVNGQPKTVARIRGVQFRGELRLLSGEDASQKRQLYWRRFPIARTMPAPVWEILPDELKFTDNTLGFGSKVLWRRKRADGSRGEALS